MLFVISFIGLVSTLTTLITTVFALTEPLHKCAWIQHPAQRKQICKGNNLIAQSMCSQMCREYQPYIRNQQKRDDIGTHPVITDSIILAVDHLDESVFPLDVDKKDRVTEISITFNDTQIIDIINDFVKSSFEEGSVPPFAEINAFTNQILTVRNSKTDDVLNLHVYEPATNNRFSEELRPMFEYMNSTDEKGGQQQSHHHHPFDNINSENMRQHGGLKSSLQTIRLKPRTLDGLEKLLSQDFEIDGVHSLGELVHKRGGSNYVCKNEQRPNSLHNRLTKLDTCSITDEFSAENHEYHKQLLQYVNMHIHTSDNDKKIFDIHTERPVMLWTEDRTGNTIKQGVETYMYVLAVNINASVMVNDVPPKFRDILQVLKMFLGKDAMHGFPSSILKLSTLDNVSDNIENVFTGLIRRVHPSLKFHSLYTLGRKITARIGTRPRSFVWMPSTMPHSAGGGSAEDVITFVSSALKPIHST